MGQGVASTVSVEAVRTRRWSAGCCSVSPVRSTSTVNCWETASLKSTNTYAEEVRMSDVTVTASFHHPVGKGVTSLA